MTVLMSEIVFGESPRWHDGHIWFADWAAGQVIRMGEGGTREVMATVPSFPLCFDFLPDGRALLVDSARRRLLVRDGGGSLDVHAELGHISTKPWNDIVVSADGDAYVNNIGFDFPGGRPGPGLVVRVTPAGSVEVVAEELDFPNGMAITADGSTLVVAESHANRLAAFDLSGVGP